MDESRAQTEEKIAFYLAQAAKLQQLCDNVEDEHIREQCLKISLAWLELAIERAKELEQANQSMPKG